MGHSRRFGANCLIFVAICLLPSTMGASTYTAPADSATQRDAVQNEFMVFHEGFDDSHLDARGWYDGDRFRIATAGTLKGGGCIEYTWKAGTTTPYQSSAIRRLFPPTESLFVRFYLKLSKGWGWSGRTYHPHLINILTTENDRFHGPAASHLTLYIEPQEGRLRLAAQDIQNKDAPRGLTQGPLRGGYNGTFFDSRDVLLTDDRWHCIEALFRLNRIDSATGEARKDGIVRGWFDGKQVIDRKDVLFRTADFPGMKLNQILIAPYFGPGLLPHEQTLCMDELLLARRKPPG